MTSIIISLFNCTKYNNLIMGNFCTTPENEEQPNTQWNPNECIDSHYS